MHVLKHVRWSTSIGALALGLVVLVAGCDIPTEGPSFSTETAVKTPLVAEKTFSFLGGPQSEFEPLVDTTTSTFDSLFTVGEAPKDITIEQTVDNFDIGTLNDALDQAAGDLSFNKQFSEPLVRDSDIAQQEVNASYSKSNQVYESSEASNTTSGLYDNSSVDQDNDPDQIAVPFPAGQLLEAPNFGAVDASGATVDSVRLTDEGAPVNQITFSLTNDGSNTLKGEGGTGTPVIEVVDAETELSTSEDFGAEISPGGTETATVVLAGESLGADTEFRLLVSGTDSGNTVTLEANITRWRYQATMLSDAQNVSIAVSNGSVSTVGQNASRFEGIEVGNGSLALGIDNHFSFDLSVDQIQVQNNEPPSWVSIPSLNIDRSLGEIPSGQDKTETVDLTGKGIASSVSVNVSASPVNDRITVAADDSLQVSNAGTLDIQTMYFRPDGEELQTSGTVNLDSDRVTFEEGDYLELAAGLIDVSQLEIDPHLTFEEFTLSYPDLLLPPYTPGDSLVVRFVQNPSGKFEFDQITAGGGTRNFEVSFEDEDIQVRPKQVGSGVHEIGYTLRGKAETGASAEGIVDIDDQVSADMSVGEFDIQELRVSQADPFSIQVTRDINEDGALDLADDKEVRTASFDGFGGIASRVDGLQLSGSNLNFSLETENLSGTSAVLYTALQGQSNESDGFFLSGAQNTDRGVSSATFEKDFVDRGTSVSNESLIKFGVDLEDVDLGRQEQITLEVNDENSNVSRFISRLPTEIRLAGQAEMNEDGGDLALRKPVTLDAGFDISVPLRFEGDFVVHDTLDADFSSLNDLTDPDQNLNVSKAAFQFKYVNELPLGADVQMTIVDEGGSPIESFSADDGLRIDPAPKEEDDPNELGVAVGAAEGSVELNLGESKEALNALANGRRIRLRLTMTQADQDPPARTRADDTIRLSFHTDIEASVRVGD